MLNERSLFSSLPDPDPETERTPSDIRIPDDEILIDAVRSSGKGGQNVNKVSTKIFLRWNVETSSVFSPKQKQRIMEQLKNRINQDGELVIHEQRQRSQLQNREAAIEKLHALVAEALKELPPRIPTNKTRSSERHRESDKRQRSRLKSQRREHGDSD